MKSIIKSYKNVYAGLSRPAWMLAFITFINRSGMMVLPFLGLYLTESLHFTVARVGVVLSFFGLGSMIGSFIGGWLCDRIGYFKVVFWSLIGGGFSYLFLAFLDTFIPLCIGIFLTSLIVDALRPAMTASITSYADAKNTTRSFSLLRMAVNMGASIGPALGGLLAVVGYSWIFIGDGGTSIAAGIVYYIYFKHRAKIKVQVHTDTERVIDSENVKQIPSPEKKAKPYKDSLFLLFISLTALYAMVFFQIFNTLPLYYRKVHEMSKPGIGLLIAMNGMIVFIFEMVLVYALEKKYFIGRIIIVGTLLCGTGLIILNFIDANWILYLSMVLLSFSEILSMPFMMTVAISRSTAATRGTYLGWYTMAWGSAFIASPLLGTFLADHYGFPVLFQVMAILTVCLAAGFYILTPKIYSVKAESQTLNH